MDLKNTERWDLFDRNLTYVKTVYKGYAIPPNLYHISVEAICVDRKGHALIIRRHPDKRGGGKYEFPAGSVLSQEQPKDAVFRELEEETGITAASVTQRILLGKAFCPGLCRFIYMLTVPDLCTVPIRLQESESVDYKIVTFLEFLDLYESRDMFHRKNKEFHAQIDNFLKKLKYQMGKPPAAPPKPAMPFLKKTESFVDPNHRVSALDENEETYDETENLIPEPEEPAFERGDDGA